MKGTRRVTVCLDRAMLIETVNLRVCERRERGLK